MGLESHVDRVLKEASVGRNMPPSHYWSNGLNVEPEDAQGIMDILDSSGEFGPTRYNHKMGKIEFGAHGDPSTFSQRKQQWVQQRKTGPVMAHRRTVGISSGKQTAKERFRENQAADAWERAKKSIGGTGMRAFIKSIDQAYEELQKAMTVKYTAKKFGPHGMIYEYDKPSEKASVHEFHRLTTMSDDALKLRARKIGHTDKMERFYRLAQASGKHDLAEHIKREGISRLGMSEEDFK